MRTLAGRWAAMASPRRVSSAATGDLRPHNAGYQRRARPTEVSLTVAMRAGGID
jgi:hypothetical protein